MWSSFSLRLVPEEQGHSQATAEHSESRKAPLDTGLLGGRPWAISFFTQPAPEVGQQGAGNGLAKGTLGSLSRWLWDPLLWRVI